MGMDSRLKVPEGKQPGQHLVLRSEKPILYTNNQEYYPLVLLSNRKMLGDLSQQQQETNTLSKEVNSIYELLIQYKYPANFLENERG